MALIVNGNIIVHVIGASASSSPAGEYSGVQDPHKRFGFVWRWHCTTQQIRRLDTAAVHFFISIPTLNHDAAFQGYSSEKSFGFRVREYARNTFETRGSGSLGVPTHWSGRNRHISTKSNGSSLCERLDRCSVIEDEDKVGKFETDLTAKSSTDRSDC